MAEASPASPSHHRPLPAAAAPAPSPTVSLRPHQAPPSPPAMVQPPPAVVSAGIAPDLSHPRLWSMVVGDLSSLLGVEEPSEALLDEMLVPSVVDGGVEAPAPPSLPPLGPPELPLPPPPAQLPPDFTPVLCSDTPGVSTERAWEEVGGRRRQRPEKAPALPPRKETRLPPAFKRRTYGLCFRCLAPDHFVVDCRGPVRCLGCHQSGHRERDCEARLSARKEPHHHSSSPPAPPCRSKDVPQAPRPGSRPPPAPSERLQRSWASVVSHQDAINLEATCGRGEAATAAGLTAVSLSSLQQFLEAQAVALSAELHAMFAARLEEVFSPLRDLVAAVQGWTDQVSGLWELMEEVGVRIALADPLTLGKNEESAPLVVSDDKDASAAAGASCSADLGGVMVQHIDDPPDMDSAPTENLLPDLEEQNKVAEVVPVCKGVELVEGTLVASSVGEVPLELTAPENSQSLKIFEPVITLGGNGVSIPQSSPTLLDEILHNFSCTAPLSLLDAPIPLQSEVGSPWIGRRSGRLEKKNKDCTIPTAKRAEFRLAEAFGELAKDTVAKRGSEEDVQEKMKPYLRLCKQPTSPTALQAIRELVQVNG